MDIKELTESFEKAGKATTALQARVEEIEGKAKKLDGIDLAMIAKASQEAADNWTKVQEIGGFEAFEKAFGTIDEQKERIKALELAMATGQHKGVGAPGGSVKTAYYKALNKGLRRAKRSGDRVLRFDHELVEANAKSIVDFYYPHMDDEDKAVATKALVSSSGPDGGYWVPVERSQQIIQRIFETSPMRQLANTITTGSNMVEMVIDDDETTAVWGGELDPHPATGTPQIGLLKIPINHLRAKPKITETMLEDGTIDVVAWLSNKVERDMGRAENTAFVLGTGANKPTGFLTLAAATDPDVYQRNTLGHVDSITQGSIEAADFVNLQNHLKEGYQGNATWLMKRRSFYYVATLRDAQGQFLLRFGDQMAEQIRMQLLGRPVVFADDMQTIANDSLSIAYGDFRQGYTIVDRVGISVLIDPYTDDPFVNYRFRKRVGGHVTDWDAIKILSLTGGGDAGSPIPT